MISFSHSLSHVTQVSVQIVGDLKAFERMCVAEKNVLISAELHGLHVRVKGGGDCNPSPVLEIHEDKYVKFGEFSVEELSAECIHSSFLDNPDVSKILLSRVMTLLSGRSLLFQILLPSIGQTNKQFWYSFT